MFSLLVRYQNPCFWLWLCLFCLGQSMSVRAQDVPNGETLLRIKNLNQLATALNRDSTNKALATAHEAYLLSIKNDLPYWQGVSLLNLAEGYLYNDSYDQALQYAFNALDLFVSVKSDSGIAQAYTMLGWIFYDTENPGFSMDYHQQALLGYEGLMQKKEIATSLNAIGLVFQMKNENDSAIVYFKRALVISQNENFPNTERAALNNLGICENAKGNYKQAIEMLEQAIHVSREAEDELFSSEVCNQMAFSYLKLKDYKMADSLLAVSRKMIGLSPSNSRKEKLLDNLKITSLLYQQTGDFKRAFDNLLEYTQISNELVSRNKTEVVMAQQLKRETQERENEINEITAQKELRIFQRNAMAVGLILLLIIGFLGYSRFNQKRKREKQEVMMKQLVMKNELENERREKEKLDSRLQYNKVHLKDYALFVKHHDELLSEFITALSEIYRDAGIKEGMNKQLQTTTRHFLAKYEQLKEEQEIKMDIDESHTDFFHNLLKSYPELTKNEQKLCAQIRMNLSSKEIAAANNISIKSVEMARYRLRKQLGLKTEDDLGRFLKQF